MKTLSRPALYPLRFREILRDYTFGARWIPRAFAKAGLPEHHRISETWEVCDRPGESSEILNGPLEGRSLHEVIRRHGPALLGSEIHAKFGGRFPLLIKLLDATHLLVEQCHPDDGLTRAWDLKDFSGKTEAWYMLRTARGAAAFCGNRRGVTKRKLLDALRRDKARSCMKKYAARPGDAFLLYAGTMHCSPGGLLFYEVMQNSDVFVGLGRMPATLSPKERAARARHALKAVHLEKDFECKVKPVTVAAGRNRRTFVLACDKFALERLDLAEPSTLVLDGERFLVLTAIEGLAVVRHARRAVRLRAGQSCLLPACLGEVSIEPEPTASLLKASVPDLARDVIAPLRATGVSDERIRGLGGRTRLNAVAGLL